MKANELRVGNLVSHHGNISVVHGITNQDYGNGILIHYKHTCIGCDEELIEPIPLTEEWLIKFGLNKTVDHPGRKLYEHDDIIPLWFSDKRGITDFYASRVRIRECKYVHQLQNLYFALTGEELTIKE